MCTLYFSVSFISVNVHYEMSTRPIVRVIRRRFDVYFYIYVCMCLYVRVCLCVLVNDLKGRKIGPNEIWFVDSVFQSHKKKYINKSNN